MGSIHEAMGLKNYHPEELLSRLGDLEPRGPLGLKLCCLALQLLPTGLPVGLRVNQDITNSGRKMILKAGEGGALCKTA